MCSIAGWLKACGAQSDAARTFDCPLHWCLADAGNVGQAGGALFYNGSEGSSLQYTYGALTANSVSFSVPDRVKPGLGGTL